MLWYAAIMLSVVSRKHERLTPKQVLSMFNPPDGAAGVTTSGGTESILMACLSAREKGRRERGITEPEMYNTPLALSLLPNLKPKTKTKH